ncbi:MAG: DUF1844 domain-containing protein [Kiritimatiellae bacterium]|nr:DUF1844 domain-containing protein [Kiritimatiellia bacterium]
MPDADREKADHRTEMKHKVLFANLVVMLASSVMQHLGKIVNPMTGKTEHDLRAAEATIDMLEMLEAKTKGNLDDEEKKLLADTLSTVRINYVETAKDAQKSEEPEEETAAGSQAEGANERSTGQQDASGGAPGTDKPKEPKDPKYHKSYG